jgi:hypothetical protein
MIRVAAVVALLLALPLGAGCRTQPLDEGDGGPSGFVDMSRLDLPRTDGPGVDLSRPADMTLVDLARSCAPNCSRCQSGVCCGTVCCRPGEYCDAQTNSCRCGNGGACRVDQICATGGPSGPNQCGAICCGDPSTPCPL